MLLTRVRGTFARIAALSIAVLAAGIQGDRALGAIGDAASSPEAAARLVAAGTVEGTHDVRAALEIKLADGWKTYAPAPGPTGRAPRLDWSGSGNVAGVEASWPVAEMEEVLGAKARVYRGRIGVPLRVSPAESGKPVRLSGTVDILTCHELCVPQSFEVSVRIPAGGDGRDGAAARIVGRAWSAAPEPVRKVPGITVGKVRPRDGALVARIGLPEGAGSPIVYPVADGWRFGPAEVKDAGDGRARVRIPVADRPEGASLSDLRGRLVVAVGGKAAEMRFDAAGDGGSGSAGWTLFGALGTALLGGLILNFMPCVLPVLAFKLAPGADGRGNLLGAAAGMAFGFVVLGAGLAAVAASGAVAGWGAPLREPAVVAALVAVTLLFAANLAGVFGVDLPAPVRERVARMGIGGGVPGAFVSGLAAAVLATPCSAPFVGGAVAFALSRGPVEIVAVCAVMGAGFAAPHVVAALTGGMHLRPGRWSAVLRRALAVPMLAVAAWLAWVLSGQAGWTGALAAAAGGAFVAGALAARERTGSRPLRSAAAGAAVAAAAAVPLAPSLVGSTPDPEAPEAPWRRLSPMRIERAVDAGRTVYVHVTADWCVTCKVNERIALSDGRVRSRLASDDVLAMRGDWTMRDERIGRFLAREGKRAVPFDAVYGPGAPDGIVLPNTLLPSDVLDALREAGRVGPGGGT